MKYVFTFVFAVFLCSCAKPQETVSPTAILISDANLIDVSNGSLLGKRHMVIDSGKIKKITEEEIDSEKYSTVINGEGKYVLPGLAEMHAHIPPPTTGQQRIEDVLFLYLSNGVTTIRGMLGHPEHLSLREKAKNNEILSPRIFTSSPSLNGNSVKSVEEAIEKVTQYKNDGYDFLKIHPGIQLAVFDQLVKTANEVGISFAGHVPVDVGIRHALESNFASIDHVDGYLEGLVPQSANVKKNENGFFGYNFSKLADTTKINELVELTKKHRVWIVPTQSLFERWFAPVRADELLKASEMNYMPASTLRNWKTVKKRYTEDNPDFNEDQWNQFNRIRLQLIRALNENGHGMLLGSDAPQLFNVPGFSIHHEIDGMLRAGMSSADIIKSGTVNPAIFFGKENIFGQLKEGLSADLILIENNPIEDITALKQIQGVLVRGNWLSKETIDSKLAEIAQRAAQN